MSTVKSSNMLVFYPPTKIPNTLTSKMIHYERDLPLSSVQAWKGPFILKDKDPILVERIQAALVKGPFVAEAKLGPKFYDDEPTEYTKQIKNNPELPIYGWKPQQRKPDKNDGAYQEIIVCGVQKRKDTEHIYYLLAEEVKTDWRTGIAEHKKTSDKVYAVSVQKFSDYLFNMYPPATKEEKKDGLKSIASRESKLQEDIAELMKQITDGV